MPELAPVFLKRRYAAALHNQRRQPLPPALSAPEQAQRLVFVQPTHHLMHLGLKPKVSTQILRRYFLVWILRRLCRLRRYFELVNDIPVILCQQRYGARSQNLSSIYPLDSCVDTFALKNRQTLFKQVRYLLYFPEEKAIPWIGHHLPRTKLRWYRDATNVAIHSQLF